MPTHVKFFGKIQADARDDSPLPSSNYFSPYPSDCKGRPRISGVEPRVHVGLRHTGLDSRFVLAV